MSKIASLETDEVGPYLRRVAINVWRSHLRRLAVEIRARALEGGGEARDAPDVEQRDDALWQAVCGLPDRQRACVVLRYYEDLSERDIAELLGCSVGTVKSHTSRALAKLRKEFGHGD
jgi:RNA polymerase sigma factor (sigma-70 family)